jgi:Cu+-exporting ATPase
MDVAVKSIAGKTEYKGQTYYFCSPGCKETFDHEPELHIMDEEEDKIQDQT